ncbi:HAD family hydrolase [Pseudothermotoga sp. U03pept]|uniref:HAD family hydrolase n=1 Tax=Pseudothermotoga sp. U03pept TaxID=3447012 RepID=UPI003F0A7BC5
MGIFDLDGTLLGVWKRYYAVFNSWWKIEGLDISTFVSLKRDLVKDEKIVRSFYPHIDETQIVLYQEYKRKNLENPEFLKLDELIVNVTTLKSLHRFLILTVRQNAPNLYSEFKRRGLDFLIEKTVVLQPADRLVKYRWVLENISTLSDCDEKITTVGDSETDLLVGMMGQVETYLVKTGLRDPYRLIEEYKDQLTSPVRVLETVNDLFALLKMNE